MSKHLLELKDRLIQFEGAATFVALAIAARSALRAVPLLEQLPWEQPLTLPKTGRPVRGPRMSHDEIVLKTFRAAATAWAAARWDSFGKSDRFQAIQHNARMAGGSSPDAGPIACFAPAAAGWAVSVASETFSRLPGTRLSGDRRASSAHLASQVVVMTSLGFLRTFDRQAAVQLHMSKDPNWLNNRDLSPSETLVWSAAWEDIRFLERDADVQSLLAQPLWLVPAPDYAQGEWPNFSARLLGRADENWKFWIDWYEAMLADPTQLDESSVVMQVS